MVELRYKISTLERLLADKEAQLKERDAAITSLREYDIAKLQRELEVERSYSKHLAALYNQQLSHVEAEIAINNERIVAHNPRPEAIAPRL